MGMKIVRAMTVVLALVPAAGYSDCTALKDGVADLLAELYSVTGGSSSWAEWDADAADGLSRVVSSGGHPAVRSAWRDLERVIKQIQSKRAALLEYVEIAESVSANTPALQARLDELARMHIGADQDASLYFSALLIGVVERIQGAVIRLRGAGFGAISAMDRLTRDVVFVQTVVQGLRNGDAGLGLKPATGPEILEKLDEVDALVTRFAQVVGKLPAISTAMLEAHTAADELTFLLDDFRDAVAELPDCR